MTYSTKIFRASAAIAALFIAACANVANGPQDAISITDRFPITVEPQMQSLRVPYNAARRTLDDAGNAVVMQFAHDYLENGAGAISVSAPRRLPDAPNAVVTRLVSLGVPRDRIMIGNDDALSTADEVRVTYIRYQARAEPCGNWSANLGDTAANKPMPNLGCATQHNLAAMVADPRDLVSPKPLDAGDAQRRLTVLDKYRKGDVTVASKTDEQVGAISTVGK